MPGAYRLVTWLYLAVPVIAAIWALLQSRRRCSFQPLRLFFLTCMIGMVMGLTVTALYAIGLEGRVPANQVAAACWWGTAIVCVLQGFNRLLVWGIGRLVNTGPGGRGCCPSAEVFGMLARATLLILIGVPYAMGMVLIYRPRLVYPGTPITLLQARYQTVNFKAADGTPLQGWWIPATRTQRTDLRHPAMYWGQRTVILCHGFGADKAADLRLVRDLVPNGYNVLAFDFRAHGMSGGQLTTFGDLERNDVLGAVHWVRENHPTESKRIFGLGESMGAAALISAATDQSADGQAIDAIAVYQPYDRLTSLLHTISESYYSPAAGWLAAHVGLPVAGLHLGTNLPGFSPAKSVQSLWPRPILVIGSEGHQTVAYPCTRALFDSAMQPKYSVWTDKEPRDTLLFGDDEASLSVRIFFETEQSWL